MAVRPGGKTRPRLMKRVTAKGGSGGSGARLGMLAVGRAARPSLYR